MNIRPKLGPDCIAAAMKAAGDRVSKSDLEAAWKRLNARKERIVTEGNVDNLAKKLTTFAEREAERTRVAAAMRRRHTARNILVRDRVEASVNAMADEFESRANWLGKKIGYTPHKKAILAVLEGSQAGVAGARNSVAALRMGYESRYLGSMLSEIQGARPHLIHALRDKQMDTDVMIEMSEIKPGGRRGVTGNDDAKFLAEVFHKYSELSRTDLNSFGAAIGKHEGWAGAQTHDDIKMIAKGKTAWIDFISGRLDDDRTFQDVDTPEEKREILSEIYDTIVTGVSQKANAASRGQRVNPPNLARSLGKSRVLHFKSAQEALAYRDEFGSGTTISGIFDHLRKAARLASAMDALGPNPEVMLNGLIDTMQKRIASSTSMTDVQKQQALDRFSTEAGPLKHALDIATGMQARPVGMTSANLGANIRAVQSMAKLGGATISSISDMVTAGAAAQFRGSGFIRGFFAQLNGLRRGRPKGELAEISFLLGEGFDGLIGQVTAANAAVDGPVGGMGSWTEKFFKWNGLSWWTDIQRAAAGRMISAEMGMRSQSSYADLPDRYRHVLGLHAIGATEWDAIRQANFREINGTRYVTPDRIRDLPDEAIEPLVQARLDAARAALKVDEAKTPETKAKREEEFAARREKILAEGKRGLELSLLRFVADETAYGIIEVDARTRRTMTLGQRPGTATGEGLRLIMQFKGFPTAFAQRIGGRALYGHHKGAGALERTAHIGTLLAGMTMAGYAAMTMKDMAKGYWPPRPVDDPATWTAAFIQGGAAGVYGDFLFSKVNRFGGGLLETIAGPTIGGAGDLWDIYNEARDAALSEDEDMRLAGLLNFALQNTPYINLAYTRPMLDYLFLNSLREVASPGYTARNESRRRTEYGQESMLPEPLEPFQ
jgi:hypothetical protein